jgi:hypothetical protein
MGLFASLRAVRGLVGQVSSLETRVRELEEAQHPARLMEWVELREQLARYLARIGTVEARLKAREGQGANNSPDPVTLAVLRSKFPRTGENGGS